MKRIFTSIAALFLLFSCQQNSIDVEVVNDSTIDREAEIVEVVVDTPQEFVVFDDLHNEIPSQVTYDGKIVFPASVKANTSATFTLEKGEKSTYETITYGSLHPEFFDDIAWENDKVGFRVSAKPQLKLGKYLYGYDVFTKRVAEPILDELYDNTFGEEATLARKVLKDNPDSLKKYIASVTYHNDHGKGMDYYLVGPTLGCGTSALVVDGQTQYPIYYDTYEILDNGPLRTTISMTFDPTPIKGDTIVESRLITMDAGSHFFKIDVKYNNLSQPTPIIAGVVMRDAAKEYKIGEGYAAYAEPAQECGQTYTAIIFPESLEARVDLFDEDRMKSHGGAFGHIQAEGVYQANETFTYYSGAGWNKWHMPTPADWFKYVEQMQEEYSSPLVVKY